MCGGTSIHIIFFPPHMYMNKNFTEDPAVELCRVMDGPDKSEFIESVLEDYTFCLSMGFSPKTLKYHRELFSELIKNFGH